jgi:predicted RecB family nuclease
MATKITREILESYLCCKTKARLKLMGEGGNKSDYEVLLDANGQAVRQQAIGKILAKHPEEDVARDVSLTVDELRTGLSYVLSADLEDDIVSLRFDGLKRVDGPSNLGAFHYVPMLFHEGRKVGKGQRLLLELYGLLLSRLQGRMPSNGIILHGKECRMTRVRLGRDLRKTERLYREVKEMLVTESSPALILNDHCQVCEFRQRCHDQAVREDSISLIRGISEKEVKNYGRKGIFTVTQLAHTFRARRKGKRQVHRSYKHHHALQALAVREQRVYVFGTPELKASSVRIYLDLEGDPDEGYVYLVGMIIVQGDSETRHSFWGDSKEQETQIYEEFLSEVSKYKDFLVFCYGGYEVAFLKKMQKKTKLKASADKVRKALINILSLVYSHIYFPTYSNGLKDIGRFLGCSWTEQDASGIQSIVWREKWKATRGEEWKQRLTTYNIEDCAALRRLTEFVYATRDKSSGPAEPRSDCRDSNAVERVRDVDGLPGAGAWAQGIFAHTDYEYINRCAYFDYQRQRVYARAGGTLRKSRKRVEKSRNRMLRVSSRIEVTASRCPYCGSTELQHRAREKQAKRVYDLVITTGSLKRKVIECRAPMHICVHCGSRFLPERYQRLDRHCHGVKSWAMYHHVAHKDSFGTLEEMAEELFGLRIYKPEFKMFKTLMSRYYGVTYRKLLKKLLSGHLLHIDETEVNLQTGKGYIWVFTNLEEVIFMYRPTREGIFLQDLLRNPKITRQHGPPFAVSIEESS